MSRAELRGIRVVVAGAGLAGLSAARELEAAGADVAVIEARDRVGGRVHTLRQGFAFGQHAEAGADLIEAEQTLVHEMAGAYRLELRRILRAGFGFYGPDRSGRRRIRDGPSAFREAARLLKTEIADYCLAGKRWDSAVAATLAGQSVADWLRRVRAGKALTAGMRGLRGFFLGDPEDLSLIALVDQFASGSTPGKSAFFRIRGGNDRLPDAMARALRGTLTRSAILRRVQQRGRGVRITVEERGRLRVMAADYCVAALPASTLRDVEFDPALPDDQRRAIATLAYGAATRMLLQFARPYWRRRGRPHAFGSDLPTGAVWDGAEEQRTPPGILSLLAGGRASRELRRIIAREGDAGVVERLAWIGKPAALLSSRVVTWEEERWSRGGYAVFDPAYDPRLRAWLARPAGRVLFAGEHTSTESQGFMNGAIESGRRAAAEIRALNAAAR